MTLGVILLFVCGMVLLMVEIFLPGGILGIFGGIALIASVTWACFMYPEYSTFIITGSVIVAVMTLIAGLYIMSRTGTSRLLVLRTSQLAEEGWVSNVSEEAILNQTGEVFTSLRPAGSIIVDDKRYDAVSDGNFIDKGDRVRVIEVQGNRVVVEKAAAGEQDA